MIFWKHIKAYNQSTAQDALWSYLLFPTKTSSVAATYNNTPVLKISGTRVDSTSDLTVSFGHLITELGSDQIIDKDITFNNNIKMKSSKKLFLNSAGNDTITSLYYDTLLYLKSNGAMQLYSSGDINCKLKVSSSKFILDDASGGGNWLQISNSSMIFYKGYIKANDSTNGYIEAATYLKAGSRLEVGTYANIGSATSHTNTGDLSAKNIYADTMCQATYFNALSDRRAKTDIQPLLIDALDLVRNTQLYSFRYKETDTPSIGIIAQDVQDVNINGFKLVDNEEATGKDLDYMSIHESKLTYILWKAVQEQQKIIDALKKEIDELKKN